MERYFNINYEFDRDAIHKAIGECIKKRHSDYICVADGVILDIANRNSDYLNVVNGGLFAICDSSYVPLYLKWLYGKSYQQYCGSEIFEDIIRQSKYRMIFLGTSNDILSGLKHNLALWNPEINNMQFVELPYRDVEDFDYPQIARLIENDNADIIWVALGAPKQERFMYYLKPHLKKGVIIAVGAAFKFFSGVDVKRAPTFLVNHHLEFVYRIFCEPKKQLKRCGWIILTLPQLLLKEYKQRLKNKSR